MDVSLLCAPHPPTPHLPPCAPFPPTPAPGSSFANNRFSGTLPSYINGMITMSVAEMHNNRFTGGLARARAYCRCLRSRRWLPPACCWPVGDCAAGVPARRCLCSSPRGAAAGRCHGWCRGQGKAAARRGAAQHALLPSCFVAPGHSLAQQPVPAAGLPHCASTAEDAPLPRPARPQARCLPTGARRATGGTPRSTTRRLSSTCEPGGGVGGPVGQLGRVAAG